MKTIVVCSALVVMSTFTLQAQQTPVQAGLVLRPKWTPIEGTVVKGAPYSAEIVTESVQTLSDGNRIVQRTTGRVYRDSEGRVRREEDRASGGPLVSITDPVAKKSLTLDPANRTARETPVLAAVEFQRYALHLRDRSLVGVPPTGYWFMADPLAGTGRGSGLALEEKLPDRTIEGVRATGVRRTTTIAAGAIGNEQPIRIVSEEWTSPDLQVLVLTELSDPRAGRSKCSRAEPG